MAITRKRHTFYGIGPQIDDDVLFKNTLGECDFLF